MNSFAYRMLGGIMIFWGIDIWIDPVSYSSKFQMTFDYSEIQIPMSLFSIILGSLFIWTTFKKK